MNAELLEGCPKPHRFRAHPHNPLRYTCEVCGGEVTETAAAWYARGLNDGGRVECPECKRQIPNGCCPYCGGDLPK